MAAIYRVVFTNEQQPGLTTLKINTSTSCISTSPSRHLANVFLWRSCCCCHASGRASLWIQQSSLLLSAWAGPLLAWWVVPGWPWRISTQPSHACLLDRPFLVRSPPQNQDYCWLGKVRRYRSLPMMDGLWCAGGDCCCGDAAAWRCEDPENHLWSSSSCSSSSPFSLELQSSAV